VNWCACESRIGKVDDLEVDQVAYSVECDGERHWLTKILRFQDMLNWTYNEDE
jgi:hypothetical protein